MRNCIAGTNKPKSAQQAEQLSKGHNISGYK